MRGYGVWGMGYVFPALPYTLNDSACAMPCTGLPHLLCSGFTCPMPCRAVPQVLLDGRTHLSPCNHGGMVVGGEGCSVGKDQGPGWKVVGLLVWGRGGETR